jgi:hypothetical protein
MTQADRLERDLANWLDDTAMPSVPDYVDEIVREAVRGQQRPRWTFVGRWLPARMAGLGLPDTRIAWRPIVALILLAMLLVAVAALVGSRQQVPPPFGQAANGLVAFSRGGDLFTFDPVTRLEVPLVLGSEEDVDPAWSLDGTRVAFLRGRAGRDVIGFVDRDGGRPIFGTRSFSEIDTDSVTWSPNGRGVAVAARGAYYFIDAATGQVSGLPFDYPELEVYWRPPDGRELVYRSARPGEPALLLFSFETGSTTTLVRETRGQVRPRGWSPDGQRFVYNTTDVNDRPLTTFVLDLDSKGIIEIDAAAGRLSNDGTRIAGYRYVGGVGRLCVAPADGNGPCVLVGSNATESDITHGDALNWSPDDEWIIVYTLANEVILIDPDGVEDDIEITADGAASWQRTTRP